jgi:hypothetical protein
VTVRASDEYGREHISRPLLERPGDSPHPPSVSILKSMVLGYFPPETISPTNDGVCITSAFALR